MDEEVEPRLGEVLTKDEDGNYSVTLVDHTFREDAYTKTPNIRIGIDSLVNMVGVIIRQMVARGFVKIFMKMHITMNIRTHTMAPRALGKTGVFR